ncbi:hypothetical protein J437_LFUL002906 [Ladona fulva]|uniref:Brix domain-containing protein n=1 Tax=Ladona fulva TaxID=123851 RepID=A0A8K0KNB6_LADFU|nr:hypothetical protein J437_LFUL002906 [Ladona fulva]
MPRRKKRGRTVRKNRQATNVEPEELKNAPHSFVIHRGIVGGYVKELTKDMRKVMEPFTASALKVRKKNTIKDFLSVAGLLHVSHMLMFTRTQLSTYLRIARFPRGPTLTFRVHNYSLARDVISTVRKQYVFQKMFADSPLVVLNGFSGEGQQLKLMVTTFQHMFPSINLSKVNLNSIRRCVLLNYNEESKIIDFRHYAVKVIPKGMSRSVKKIIQSKVPNLAHLEDISEFFSKAANLSESEAEDDPNSHVILPQKVASRGNMVSAQSAIRVVELGPRLSLQLIKVEDALLGGDILYHELIKKTEEEKLLIKKRRAQKMMVKMKRKMNQEKNVKRKEQEKEVHKKKSLKGMNKLETDLLMKKAVEEGKQWEDDDDAEWYRKEVGKEPDRDLFGDGPKKGLKRKKEPAPWMKRKKQKLENENNRSTAPKNRSKRNKSMPNEKSKRTKNFPANANHKKFKPKWKVMNTSKK